MKLLVVLAVAVACASADVSHVLNKPAEAVILRDEISPDGGYPFASETGNGIYSQASGSIKNPNSENPIQEIVGTLKYTSAEGIPIEATYTADENEFIPQSTNSKMLSDDWDRGSSSSRLYPSEYIEVLSPNLPVGPPNPEQIQRSLDYIAANPPKSETSAYQGTQKALVG